MPKRRQYLFVCLNRRPDGSPKGSCAMRGSEAIYAALKEQLKEKGLARVEARACSCSCLDLCLHGPSIAVEPDHVFYGHVTLEDVPEIVQAVQEGRLVERLIVSDEAFDPPKREG